MAGPRGHGRRMRTGSVLRGSCTSISPEGRLSLEELQRRLDLVFAAQTLIDLYELTSDLPHPGPQLPRSSGVESRRQNRRRPWWPFG